MNIQQGTLAVETDAIKPSSASRSEVVTMKREQGTFKEVLRNRFVAAATSGSQQEASAVVDTAIAQGMNPKAVYLELIVPAQRQIGEMWFKQEITVAQQHLATEISFAELGRLRPMLKRRRSIGKTIVVCSVEGDPHSIGGRIVSDFLFMEGWEVEFLGGALPVDALVQHLCTRKPDVVALSVTIESALDSAKALIAAIKDKQGATKTMVGGPVVDRLGDRVHEIGADAYCNDANKANSIARQLVGLPQPASSLPEYLKTLGERIQSIRKSQQMSQQDVALGSGLERAYISAIEHGKHNITLGAVMKLAEALHVPFEELLVGGEDSRDS